VFGRLSWRGWIGVMMEFVQLLGQNLLLSMGLFVLLWLVNLRTRDPSFIDAWWPLGMVVTAWATYLFVGHTGAHAMWLTALCTAWGLRLGIYLFWRWRRHGPDRRYVALLGAAQKERGWGYPLASLLLVFALQWPLQFVVSLPVQLGQMGIGWPLGVVGWAGVAVSVFGIVFESVGDFQLLAFKADPANAGKVLQTGLWRYTRHPNYFGDACVWWGLWLIAFDADLGQWSLPGPILITLLLTRWSGVPTAEGGIRRRRPDYDAYVQRTSAFIPMPPKKPSSAG
jgi:steroid 5-alpha reductase family enzyme